MLFAGLFAGMFGIFRKSFQKHGNVLCSFRKFFQKDGNVLFFYRIFLHMAWSWSWSVMTIFIEKKIEKFY